MAGYRKLGRTSSQRKALIRGQVTALLNNGKIVTTEAKAKEIRKVAEKLIAMAVKEKDNFDEVTVTAKVARKDKDGKRVKEVVDGKKVTVYDEVEKKISFLFAVYNFFYSLAVSIFAGNLCCYGNSLKVIFLTYSHSDQAFRDLADFLSFGFCCDDLSVIQKICYLIS